MLALKCKEKVQYATLFLPSESFFSRLKRLLHLRRLLKQFSSSFFLSFFLLLFSQDVFLKIMFCVVSCYLGVVGHTWAWFRIVLCGFAWFPLVSRSFAWFCMVSQDFTWFHVVSRMVSRGFAWFRVAFICPEKNYRQKSSKSYI